jgi:hypothetical protein
LNVALSVCDGPAMFAGKEFGKRLRVAAPSSRNCIKMGHGAVDL